MKTRMLGLTGLQVTPLGFGAASLQAGDADAASFVGLPAQYLPALAGGAIDPQTQQMVADLVRRGGMTAAFNDAWLLIGGLILLSLLLLPLLRPVPLGATMLSATEEGRAND